MQKLTNSVRTLSMKEVKRGMRTARGENGTLAGTSGALPDHARDAGGRLGRGCAMSTASSRKRPDGPARQPAVRYPETQANVLVSLTRSRRTAATAFAAAVHRLNQRLDLPLAQAALLAGRLDRVQLAVRRPGQTRSGYRGTNKISSLRCQDFPGQT